MKVIKGTVSIFLMKGPMQEKRKLVWKGCTADIYRIVSIMAKVDREQQFLSHQKQTKEGVALHNM